MKISNCFYNVQIYRESIFLFADRESIFLFADTLFCLEGRSRVNFSVFTACAGSTGSRSNEEVNKHDARFNQLCFSCK